MPTPRFSPWLRVLIFGVGALLASAALVSIVVVTVSVAALRAGRDALGAQPELGEYALWVSVLSYPTIWLWLMFCRRQFDKRPVRALGLRTQNSARALMAGAVAGVLAVAWLCGVLWLCGGVRFNGWSVAASEATPLFIVSQLALYGALFGAVGFMEEAVFRGYALHNISAAVGLRAAIWLQALGFAAIHLGNVGASGSEVALRTQWLDALRAMPSLALIGAIFALCWAKSGTLWYPIGFHAAWNFALGCVFSLPVSGLQTFHLFDIEAIGNDWLTGGSFGAEGSVLLWPILGALWWTLHRMPDHPQALHDVHLLQTTPQVLATSESATTPESEPKNLPQSARKSRFQTSMRAAREADEANSEAIPIWGQLPRPDADAAANAVTDFSHDWTTLEKRTSSTQPPAETTETFQFQPLPIPDKTSTTPQEETQIKTPQVLAAPVDETEVVPESETPTPQVETPQVETPTPARRRPTPRW